MEGIGVACALCMAVFQIPLVSSFVPTFGQPRLCRKPREVPAEGTLVPGVLVMALKQLVTKII